MSEPAATEQRLAPWPRLRACFEIAAAPAAEPRAPLVRGAGDIETLNGFVENRGQWPADVLFFGRWKDIEATLTRSALVLKPRDFPDPT